MRNPFLSQLLSSSVLTIFSFLWSHHKEGLHSQYKSRNSHRKKNVLILKINFFFEEVLPIYFQTYTMKKIPQEGQEQVLFLLVLVTFEKQLSPNRWLEAFNILHLLSLICLAQAPVEKFS